MNETETSNAYTAEAAAEEIQRLRAALAENNRNRADDCGYLARTLLDTLQAMENT